MSDNTVPTKSIPPAVAPLISSQEHMKSRPVSVFYQLGLGLVTFTMVLLPVVYFALTAMTGYGVYHFATHYFPEIWEWHVSGRYGILIKALCSCTPLVVGTIIVIFMVKPIFAPQVKQMQPITLNPEHEPLFTLFVQRICAIVGAPAPREIRLDCEVNASAGFRRGFRSFLGHDLVLTVGLPLVAGLSMRELAGVVAHEFGHFTQGAAMRLSYLIRRVNLWFARVIYGRDSWDEALEEWSESETWWVSFVVRCAQVGVWFSRFLLKVLMYFGHAISSFLMRQMEFDADRCFAHIAGSEAQELATLRLRELGATMNHLHREMDKTWRTSHRLPDNIPLLVGHHIALIPKKVREELEASIENEKTGWLDTHPADIARIIAVRRIAAPGIFSEDAPATELFENFASLGKFVTLAHYDDDLQIPTTEDFLIPAEAVLNPPKPTPQINPEPPMQPLPQAPRWQGPPK